MNKQKLKRKAMICATTLLVSVTCLYGTAIAGEPVDKCTIIDDGVSGVYCIDSDDIMTIIRESDIEEIGNGDIVNIEQFDTKKTIVIERNKDIYIDINSETTPYQVYSTTVEDAIKEIGLNTEGCEIITPLNTKVEDGLVIQIKKQIDVQLTIDDKTKSMKALYEESIEDFLIRNNIDILDNDFINVSLKNKITEETNILIKKAITETVTNTENIKYETKIEYNSELSAGEKKIITKGAAGTKEITKEIIKYFDGEIIKETVLKEVITKEPITEVIQVGTKISNDTKTYKGISVGDVIEGNKSHYCACGECGTGSGNTASGKKVYNGMQNPYYIACNWLPLGAVVDIDGQIYTVADRGGSGLNTIGRVDIFTPDGHSACYELGIGRCTITILSL